MLLHLAAYCWIPLNAAGSCWMLLDAAAHSWMRLDAAGYCRMLLDTAASCWILPSLLKFAKALNLTAKSSAESKSANTLVCTNFSTPASGGQCWILSLHTVRYCWILLHTAAYCWILLDTAGYCLDTAGYCWILLEYYMLDMPGSDGIQESRCKRTRPCSRKKRPHVPSLLRFAGGLHCHASARLVSRFADTVENPLPTRSFFSSAFAAS